MLETPPHLGLPSAIFRQAIEADPTYAPAYAGLAESYMPLASDAVDAILHPILMERLDWYSVVDLLPERELASRRRLLEQAVEIGASVMAFHLPFLGLGRVTRAEDGFSFSVIV
jgi:hypothetical protein